MADDARVLLVRFETETEAQMRKVRSPSSAGLRAGAYVFVETGVTWVQCVVERHGFDGIYVRRAPDPNKAPSACR